MLEASQLRSALLLAFPDQWAAQQQRSLLPPIEPDRATRISGGIGPTFDTWAKV